MKTVALPKYERVKRQIAHGIEAGRWETGALFPFEAQLLREFEASRPTLVRALREGGIRPDPRGIPEGQHAIDSEAGRAMMAALLKRKDRAQGVVGASNSKTIGAMAHALERGLSIPEDLDFVSIDNTLADQAPLPWSGPHVLEPDDASAPRTRQRRRRQPRQRRSLRP